MQDQVGSVVRALESLVGGRQFRLKGWSPVFIQVH